LETVLLGLISNETPNGLHGYAIFNAIQRKFAVRLGPSTLYPELKLMESRGLVKSLWGVDNGRPRKKYKITESGQNLLYHYSAELKVIIPASATCCGQI